MSLKELIGRASVANVTAAIILICAAAYAVYAKDVEILKYLSAFGAGYLFSKSTKGEGGR
jgi:hypothetical protein